MIDIFQFFTKKEIAGPIIIIFIGYIIYKILEFIISRISLKGKTELDKKRIKTIIELFQNIAKYLIFVICFLIILEIYGVDTGKLVAGLGVVGIVIGLALQDTIKDFISGINIIMDNYYVIGDIIEITSFKGEVIQLGLRSTKIRKNSGEVLTISNRNINSVVNYSQKNAYLFYEITVSNKESSTKIEKILKGIMPQIETLKDVKTGEVIYSGISQITDNATVIYTLSIKCERNTQNSVKNQVNKIIKDEFDKKKIKTK